MLLSYIDTLQIEMSESTSSFAYGILSNYMIYFTIEVIDENISAI